MESKQQKENIVHLIFNHDKINTLKSFFFYFAEKAKFKKRKIFIILFLVFINTYKYIRRDFRFYFGFILLLGVYTLLKKIKEGKMK